MQIPILSGIYTDQNSDFRVAYPRNLSAISVAQGISNGYLRPAEGIVAYGDGPGVDRGGFNWNGVCYRVMGTKFVSIDATGVLTTIGDVGTGGQVTFDYSFDYLGIASGGNLFLYNGTTLQQITDPDLGYVYDFIWIDGYFMFTDGEFIGVTELNDPFSVDPLKYGSSEADPDPVVALWKLKNEAYALNRYTIEVFDNVGGAGFPFARVEGAQIQRGTVGTHANCVFLGSIAFMGGGRNEAISIYLGANSDASPIATREIDLILQQYTEQELSDDVVMTSRIYQGHQELWVQLPRETLIYDATASAVAQQAIWTVRTSGIEPEPYRAGTPILCYNQWIVGDPTSTKYGYLTDEVSTHYQQEVGWEFSTPIVYNEGRSAVLHELELVAITGNVALGANPQIGTEYSSDGRTWSQRKYISAGTQGQRNKRLCWFRQGFFRNWRVQRFSGTSDAFLSFARLEARIEPMQF